MALLERTDDPSLRTAIRCRLARALAGLEEYTNAYRVAESAALDAATPSDRASAYVEMARALATEGELDRAVDALSKCDAEANAPEVRLRRELVAVDVALTRFRFGVAEKALADVFGQHINGPLADEAALGHARLQYLRGNFHQAVAEVNRLLERAKGDDLQALALFTLARALLDQERPAPVDAEQAISSALVLARSPAIAAIATACFAVVQAHFGNAEETRAAIARAPGMTLSKRYAAEAHCLSGDALRKLDRYSDARMHYQKALGLDSGSLEALWGLGTCAQMSGLYEVAESYFQLCIEAAPEHFLGHRSENAIET